MSGSVNDIFALQTVREADVTGIVIFLAHPYPKGEILLKERRKKSNNVDNLSLQTVIRYEVNMQKSLDSIWYTRNQTCTHGNLEQVKYSNDKISKDSLSVTFNQNEHTYLATAHKIFNRVSQSYRPPLYGAQPLLDTFKRVYYDVRRLALN